MSEISKAFERELRALGRIKNAKGYAAWLGTASGVASDRARAEAAAKDTRLAVDFGASGERLARTGLADDGYAAYLREAAKQQRSARILDAETARADETRQALAGYREYLLSLRKEDEEHLIDAARDVLSLERDRLPALNRILDGAETTAAQRRLLEYAYRNYSTAERSKEDVSTLRFLIEGQYNYERAYEYCLLIGMSPSLARRMAEAADDVIRQNWEKYYELFGDEADQSE